MFSPYIDAIQKVTGLTPGEKYQTLHRIAKSIIDNGECVDGMFDVQPSEELPELLIPLVKLEIALILRQPGGIIDALKSEDNIVFNRALKAKWFFDSSIENCLNAENFRDFICPAISVYHRMKIIKVLANNLAVKKQTSTAEEFYKVISESYGHYQARCLLKACSEPFIMNVIKDQQIVLLLDEVNDLFSRYPTMIIKYLKNKEKNEKSEYNYGISVKDCIRFLPKLLKNHSNHFIEIIRIYGSDNVNLESRYYTKLFLRNQLDALIKDPKLFLPILPIKEVIKKLTLPQLAEMVKILFPKKLEEFDFDSLFIDIFKYVPQDQRISLIMSCFEEVYGKSLTDCSDKLTAQAMRLLPREERIRQARKKLETDKQWYTQSCGWYTTRSWRCYLPIEESIPLIKEQIRGCEDAGNRVSLLTQLIYTCRINDNQDALLDVLKYIIAHHRNERGWVWKSIFDRLALDFQLHLLPSEHWNIVYEIILNNVNNLSNDYDNDDTLLELWNLLKNRIHFDLIHNQLITAKIQLMIQINTNNTALDKWNIIEEVAEYERKCLHEFLTLLPTELSREKKNHSYKWKTATVELIKSMYSFNERHCKKEDDQSQKLLVKNYPWLEEAVNNIFNEPNQSCNEFDTDELKSALKSNEPDLWTKIQPGQRTKTIPVINLCEAVVILRHQPEKILRNWKKYYRKCKREVHRKSTIRFLRACRWYQEIPIKFIDQAIKEFFNEQDKGTLIVISTLVDGPSFEQFIDPFLPEIDQCNKTFMDKKDPVLSSIHTCLVFLNPPISLDFVLKFCKPDFVHCILEYLLYLGEHTPVDQLLPFCDQLSDQAVSVRKHVSRLLRMAVNDEQLCTRLISLWRTETHKSIRLVIGDHLFHCFLKHPSPESWKNMSECFDNLKATEREALELPLKSIKKVSNQFRVDYIKKLLNVFEQIGDHEDKFNQYNVWRYTLRLFNDIMTNVAVLFPEEFHRELLEKYLINSTLPKEILTVARKYLMVVYIESAGDKLDDRLEFFSYIFTRIVKDKWDQPVDANVRFCPANYFVHKLTEDIIYQMKYSPIKSKLIDTALKTFLTLLKPQQEPEFYCNFRFASLYNDGMSWEEFTSKIYEFLPSILEIFTPEFMHYIAQFLHKLINLFYGEQLQLHIIEKLVEFNNDNAKSLAAALLLNEKKNSNDERFWKIFRVLRKHRHPLITSSAYLAVHSMQDYAS